MLLPAAAVSGLALLKQLASGEDVMSAVNSQAYVGVGTQSEYFNILNHLRTYIDGGAGSDFIFSYDQDDYIIGGLGRDIILGGLGNDVILGDSTWNDTTFALFNLNMSAVADAISGGGGNDIIYAGAGANFVNADEGDDAVVGGSGNEYLEGGAGNDVISGLGGNDVLIGGTAATGDQQTAAANYFGAAINPTFDGLSNQPTNITKAADNAVSSTATTGTGDDYLDGGAGNDTIYGQDGNDILLGGDGDDFISGDIGVDTITAGSGADTVYGGDGADYIDGGAGNDFMGGDSGNDLILGGDGNDVLSGGGDEDYIIGGAGYDLMYGGYGQDVFAVAKTDGQDIIFGEGGTDTVNFTDRNSSDLVSVTATPNGYSTVLFNDGDYTSVSGIEYLAFQNTSFTITS